MVRFGSSSIIDLISHVNFYDGFVKIACNFAKSEYEYCLLLIVLILFCLVFFLFQRRNGIPIFMRMRIRRDGVIAIDLTFVIN